MSDTVNFIDTFADSVFGREGGVCVFESSGLGESTLLELALIIGYVARNFGSNDIENLVVAGGEPTKANAIGIVVAMCLGLRVEVVNSEARVTAAQRTCLSSIIHNALEEGVGKQDSSSAASVLNECKLLFTKNASKFNLQLQTSGSTSEPKRVVLDGNSICYQAVTVAEAIGLNESDKQLMYMPFNYVYGLSVLTTSLYSGSVLVESNFTLESPKSFFDQIKDKEVTVFSGVPYVYNLIAKKWGLENLVNSNLRMLTQAGGGLNKDIKNDILNTCNDIVFWVMYGQTEFGGRISQFNLTKNKGMIDSAGKPLEGVQLAVDPDEANHVAPGVGEIFVSSISEAKNISELARSTEIDGTTYYSTGDIGYITSGYLHITGRNKSFVKVAGKRVNLEQIQKTYRSVDSAIDCVVEYDDRRFPLFLVGVISDAYGHLSSQQEIKSEINSKLAEKHNIRDLFAGVPHYIYAISGSLPRLPSNKPDLSKLKEIIKQNHYEKKSIHIRL